MIDLRSIFLFCAVILLIDALFIMIPWERMFGNYFKPRNSLILINIIALIAFLAGKFAGFAEIDAEYLNAILTGSSILFGFLTLLIEKKVLRNHLFKML